MLFLDFVKQKLIVFYLLLILAVLFNEVLFFCPPFLLLFLYLFGKHVYVFDVLFFLLLYALLHFKQMQLGYSLFFGRLLK